MLPPRFVRRETLGTQAEPGSLVPGVPTPGQTLLPLLWGCWTGSQTLPGKHPQCPTICLGLEPPVRGRQVGAAKAPHPMRKNAVGDASSRSSSGSLGAASQLPSAWSSPDRVGDVLERAHEPAEIWVMRKGNLVTVGCLWLWVQVCVHMHVHVSVCAYARTTMHSHVFAGAYACACMFTGAHTWERTHEGMTVHTCVCGYTCMSTCVPHVCSCV